MATATEVSELRVDVAEPNNAEPWTDTRLSELIDELGYQGAAKRIWEAKSAAVAHLVNISEGGSSRQMAQLHKNFLDMADRFGPKAEDTSNYPRTRNATRA